MEQVLRTDGGVIRVANSRGRGQSVFLGGFAAGLAALAAIPPAALDGLPVQIAGRGASLLVAGLCLAAAFWWSEVAIDPAAGQVVIARRWGPWRTVYRRPLSAFGAVVLAAGEHPWVYLEHADGTAASNRNHARSVVWGRSYEETRRLAVALADRLGLPLKERPAD